MSKRHSSTAGPQVAQVDAIERLLDERRYHEARAKAKRLSAQFPTHVRLRDLRVRAAASVGEMAHAALLAYDWTQEQPNSQRAWALMRDIAADFGLGYLAHHAHLRLETLGAVDPARAQQIEELITTVRAKYPTLDDAQGLQSDRGLMLLIGDRLDAARAELEGCTHAVPRTNLAAVLFDSCDVAAAIEVARSAWHTEASNAHAARTLVRALLYSGDADEARAAGVELAGVTVSEPDELAAQLEALCMLEDFAAARRCYEAFAPDKLPQFRSDIVARLKHIAAAAYWNLDIRDKAALLWREASEGNPAHPLYRANLATTLDTDSDEPVWFELMGDAFPSRQATLLNEAVDAAGGADAVIADPSQVQSQLDAHSAYLGWLLRHSDPLCRALVRHALARRAFAGEALATDLLKRFLVYPRGGDRERSEALRALHFAQAVERKAEVEIFLGGAVRRLTIEVPEVRELPLLPSLPEAAREDYISAVFARQPAQQRDQLTALRKWLDTVKDPHDRQVLIHRIMVLLYSLRGREAEAKASMDAALATGDALPRVYGFAARMAIARRDADTATRLLDGQVARCDGSDEDLAPVLLATHELHLLRGELETAMAAKMAYEALGAFPAAA
ncbi:MAG: hypothetical protein FJY37_05250 [Betaproteobacteria bacterium]|nr:hypothetical protein [Betaproteobacteria bacterium]